MARRLDISRKTVKRYWEMPVEEYEEMSQGICRMQVLDRYEKQIVRRLLEFPTLTAAQVSDWLKELDTDLDVKATDFVTTIRTDKSRYARDQFRLIRSLLDQYGLEAALEQVNHLLVDLRFAQVDFDTLYAGQNGLTPLESVELFLQEQQHLRGLKQNLLCRKRANLPAEKVLDSFDFGFQRSVSREQMLHLSDMTWVEQAFNICFLGLPSVGKTYLALSLAATWAMPLPL